MIFSPIFISQSKVVPTGCKILQVHEMQAARGIEAQWAPWIIANNCILSAIR